MIAARALVLLLLPALAGCYYFRQAKGQAAVLLGSRDLAEVHRDPSLDESRRAKVDLIRAAKAFAEERLGLRPTRNYTTYFDTGRRAVTYVVSACRKDRFESRIWSFPLIGSFPYKGFFSLEDAQREAETLRQDDWDVSMGESAAYSTLGWFRDPVFSSMLDLPDAALASTIIHELVHATLFVPDQADFNESFAAFVGNEAAVRFLEERHGAGSAEARLARARFHEEERFDLFLRDLYRRLSGLYGSGRPREEILAERERIFEDARGEWAGSRGGRWGALELNNAEIVARLRYGRYNLFRRAFERVRGSWPAFFATVSAAARSGDPLRALEAPAVP